MNRVDRGVTAALVLLFGLVAVGILWPAAVPPTPAASSPTPGSVAVYREGVLGSPSSITPLTARTQADRDLVALVFSGLVRHGPDGSFQPELASSWSVNAKGDVYTFRLRPDARWQDGPPVTAADVLFTVGLLKDPAYHGPLAGSWREVTASAIDSESVQFDLATPVAGFLGLATLPLLPAHLLRGVPVDQLADSDFSRHPVGSGHFRLVSWDAASATLEPVVPAGTAASPSASASGSSGPVASPDLAGRRVVAELPKVELDFFTNATAMAAAFRAGRLTAAGGLPPEQVQALEQLSATRLIRYPTSDLTAVVLNLRPSHPEFRDARVRLALLEAIDRDAIVSSVLLGTGERADTLVPPSSWAFDPAAAGTVPADPAAAAAGLRAAGWTKKADGWYPKGAKAPLKIELASVDAASNPVAWATALAVAADWGAIGLTVDLVGLTPTALVSQRLEGGNFSAALIDVDLGSDPDLYPLLASTQAVSTGSNVSGVQDPALDKLLVAARAPGTLDAREKAFSALEAYLAKDPVMLPIYYRDYVFLSTTQLSGPDPRQISDPSGRYWDVLDWRLAGGG